MSHPPAGRRKACQEPDELRGSGLVQLGRNGQRTATTEHIHAPRNRGRLSVDLGILRIVAKLGEVVVLIGVQWIVSSRS